MDLTYEIAYKVAPNDVYLPTIYLSSRLLLLSNLLCSQSLSSRAMKGSDLMV